jgi:hypothetical protein
MRMDKKFIADPFIEAEGLKRCEFDDECDYCVNPENGIYVKMYYPPEDSPEAEYYICGKCVVENQKQNNGHFNQYKLPPIV